MSVCLFDPDVPFVVRGLSPLYIPPAWVCFCVNVVSEGEAIRKRETLPAKCFPFPRLTSLVTLAEQMGVEFVNVAHLLAADVALPRIALAVATLVKEVQCLIGELDSAEQALQVPLRLQSPGQKHVSFRSRGRDGTV